MHSVEAVWLGGSHAVGQANATSDLDLYVYTASELPAAVRASVITARASAAEVGYDLWEVEDYWLEQSGLKVEAMYRQPEWETQYLDDLFTTNRARMGFSTTGWHSIVHAHVLFDRNGWTRELKALADRPYPDELAAAIIELNSKVLRGTLVTHSEALASALARSDLAFAHSRVNEILNSYFDVLFALNRTLHPGAKRQLANAQTLRLRPGTMVQDVADVLQSSLGEVSGKVEKLLDGLGALLERQNLTAEKP